MYRILVSALLLSGYSGVCSAQDPLVDDHVWREMDRAPLEEHPLILAVELVSEPLDLSAMLPTTDDYNDCTDAWLYWQQLVERRDAGEEISETVIEDALLNAQTLDSRLCDIQDFAYETYAQDYDDIVSLSVPPVLEKLQLMFDSDKLRWPSEHVQFLTLNASFAELEQIIPLANLERISYDIEFKPALDESRLSIRADEVHDGIGGVGPYTGAGVKVAIIDSGYDESHSRLPSITGPNKRDFTDSDDTAHDCADIHGSFVAGVVFCQPGQNDDYLGIAYNATPVNAKVAAMPYFGCMIIGESWATTQLPGIVWALGSIASVGADADVANFKQACLCK